MKETIFKLIFAISIAILFSNCAALHIRYKANSESLRSAIFSYVKQNLNGKLTVKYKLGFGSFKKETLLDGAKQQMFVANPLKSNQTLANLTVNFKETYYSFYLYIMITCIVIADAREFK